VVASWARYAEGIDESGAPITVVDRLQSEVMALAARNTEDPLAFVKNRTLFGDLAEREGFTREYLWALSSLKTVGARATLQKLLQTNG
jgi:mannitol 2-dehydrogenase